VHMRGVSTNLTSSSFLHPFLLHIPAACCLDLPAACLLACLLCMGARLDNAIALYNAACQVADLHEFPLPYLGKCQAPWRWGACRRRPTAQSASSPPSPATPTPSSSPPASGCRRARARRALRSWNASRNGIPRTAMGGWSLGRPWWPATPCCSRCLSQGQCRL